MAMSASGPRPLTILHVITALDNGGAEAMLAKLVSSGDAAGTRHVVVSLMALGVVGRELAARGVEVHALGMPRGHWRLGGLLRLVRLVRALRPDIVQGWMYHGNIAAWAARALGGRHARLAWNIRHSVADLVREGRSTARMIRWNAILSRRADLIIFNARSAIGQHAQLGFDISSARLVPNGFDLSAYRPDDARRERRAALTAMLGTSPEAILVGMIARVHPMKDHANLIAAVRQVRDEGHDIHLVLAGSGTEHLPRSHAALLADIPSDRVSLLGDRRDLSSWLPGLDIAVLPSAWGEGFPNVVGEAMAAAIPCLVTDVGDSREIVSEGGLWVAPADAHALAKSLALLIEAGPQLRESIGAEGRRRIADHYSIERIVARYAEIYRAEVADREAMPTKHSKGVRACAG